MRFLFVLSAAALVVSGCSRPQPVRYQGYLEGEFVYVASPLAGRVEKLAVARGAQVEAGALLFVLERQAELAAQAQSADQLRATESRLQDLKKGLRPEEIASLQARFEQARAAAELARLEFERIGALHKTSVVSENDFDRARLNYEQAIRLTEELSAQLATAKLGGRPDLIAAAEAEVNAARAGKQKADWSVDQKTQVSPQAALVYDTLYRAGEFAAAGSPVVALLPPDMMKARFFVPEADFAKLKAGDAVDVTITGKPAMKARVAYLSPKPEYTPPILYNRENRAKLVFMVEAVFSAADALDLHPGQPVDVTLP